MQGLNVLESNCLGMGEKRPGSRDVWGKGSL